MNHGKFFSLDLAASRIEDGIAVFDYTDIYDANIVEGTSNITPRCPIFVSITSTSVKFILQYCVYLKNANQTEDKQEFVATIDPDDFNGDFAIRHMEEVLIELPITTTSGLSLAATLKRLYSTPFPICLQTEKNYFLELVKDRYEFGVGHNYVLKRADDRNESNLHYSVLSIWNLYDKDFGYILFNNSYKYNKVLRKLILDFFFDMMHSDVFKNSVHYDEMYSLFMSNYFCSAIIRKAEFYYQRALVNDLLKDNQSISDSIAIYAENLERAEKYWIECIQSPESDKHFKFQPNWYEHEHNIKDVNTHKWFTQKIINWYEKLYTIIFSPYCEIINTHAWFASPEEELRGVYYPTDDKCIPQSDMLYMRAKESQCTTDNPMISLDNHHLQQRRNSSSKWLLKRYNFKDAYRISWCRGANTLCICMLLAIIIIALTPCFDALNIILYILIANLPLLIVCWLAKKLTKRKTRFSFEKIIFFYPRLIAAITAAWLTITLGEDLYKAFFDIDLNGWSLSIILLFIWAFVTYEVHRIVPRIEVWRKLLRAGELMIISFAISLVVGICVINFTGDRMLVRSGILPKMYRDDVLVNTTTHHNGDPTLRLNFGKIAEDTVTKWTDSIVMNYYTHSPYSHLDSTGASLAVRQFADTPYDNTYMQRVANIYLGKDSLITNNTPTDLADSISLVRGRFLLNHDNSLLFKDLLPYVEHRDDNHPVAKIVPLGNYKLFLLHDFLIQFAVIAMFIGIFIQMIFEEKNVTES